MENGGQRGVKHEPVLQILTKLFVHAINPYPPVHTYTQPNTPPLITFANMTMANNWNEFHVNNASFKVLSIPASGNCLYLSVEYFWKGIISETIALQLRRLAMFQNIGITLAMCSPWLSVRET